MPKSATFGLTKNITNIHVSTVIKIIFIKVRSSEIETTCSMGYVITENNSILMLSMEKEVSR